MKRLSTYLAPVAMAVTLSACGSVEFKADPMQTRTATAAPAQRSAAVQPVTWSSPAPVTTAAPRKTVTRQDALPTVRDVPGTVVVQRGDTLYAISRKYGVPVRALIDRNNLRPPYALAIGQRLQMPRSESHIVQPGDTLYSISRRYSTDTFSLAQANDLTSPWTIVPGQRLNLPTAGTVKAVYVPAPSQNITGATPVRKVSVNPKPAKPKTVTAKAVPRPPARTGKGFSWPVQGQLVSNFGSKDKGLHNDGINISAPKGTKVKAAENGVVAYAGNEVPGYGNMLLIKHQGGYVTAYAHNAELLVKRGDKVTKGQPIATVGSSGNVTKPQLHFEIRKGMKAVNPKKYLDSKKKPEQETPAFFLVQKQTRCRG